MQKAIDLLAKVTEPLIRQIQESSWCTNYDPEFLVFELFLLSFFVYASKEADARNSERFTCGKERVVCLNGQLSRRRHNEYIDVFTY